MIVALIVSILVNIALFIYLVRYLNIKQYHQNTKRKHR